MTEFQPPEELRDKIAEKILADWWPAGDYEAADRESVRTTVADVLAALFGACTVREDPHMWLGDGTRGPRSLVLRFPLPDEPMPEPGPMPPELAEALAKVRAKLAAEKGADGGHR